MSTLFNIQTCVSVRYHGEQIEAVKIIAEKQIRSQIWGLATNDVLNPGAAKYEGGAPTIMTLSPYPGYDGNLVANMAYAFALLANVTDWESLFRYSAHDLVGEKVTAEGFAPDLKVVAAFQRLYVAWKSVQTLKDGVRELRGLNTDAIYDWHKEAVECLRRTGGLNHNTVSGMVDTVEGYAHQARAIDATKDRNRQALYKRIERFEAGIVETTTTVRFISEYVSIKTAIEDEADRLNAETEAFDPAFNEIQFSLMVTIRKATPPAPPAPKK